MSTAVRPIELVPRHGTLRARAAAIVGTDPDARFDVQVTLDTVTFLGVSERPLLRLDRIRIPVTRWTELTGLDVSFPTNPATGYVDGSLTLANTHSPADLFRLRFGAVSDGRVRVKLDLVVDFEHEGPRELGRVALEWDAWLALEPAVLPPRATTRRTRGR